MSAIRTKEQKEKVAFRERKRKASILEQMNGLKSMLPGNVEQEKLCGNINQAQILRAASGYIKILEDELKTNGINIPNKTFMDLLKCHDMKLKKAEEVAPAGGFTFGSVGTWSSEPAPSSSSSVPTTPGSANCDDLIPTLPNPIENANQQI